MFKRNVCQLLVLALLSPAASLALGLGDIHLKSALNAPLDAEIDVVGASPEDLASLKAQLASREAFTRAGVDYPSYLSSLRLTPEKSADGRNILHVRTLDPVTEPFATLLVEVDWPRGHVVREFTVLIDPPVFSGSQTSGNAVVAAPSSGASARSGSVERANAPAASAAGSSASSRSTSAATSAAGGGTYTVRSGDTLSAVAAQNYPGSDHSARERQLVGIYRANPNAFEGNMNVLRSGSRLQLPGDADLQAISPGEASSEVRRQYQAWAGTHAVGGASGSGQLHLVPPQQAAAPTTTAPSATPVNPAVNPGVTPGSNSTAAAAASAAAANNAVLNQKVQQLESQLAESQRLLQARNDELAQLQARASQAPPAKVPAPTVAPPPAPTQNVTPAPVTAAPPPAAAPPAAVPATPPATPPATTPAPTPKPVTAAPAAAPAAGTSFMDLIGEYWYVPAILIAIVLGLLVMRLIRSRQEDEFDRSVGRLHPAFEGTVTSSALRPVDTMPVRTLPASVGEQSYRVEESGAHEQPTALHLDRTSEGPAIATGEHVVIDDTVTGEHPPVALDQGDPLAEADFHMAYGLYDQAADLVQIAMSREPNRRDLKLKLLEVFFVWGNKDRFLQSARELANTRDQALPGEWEKVVIMGRQIAPEDPLFASGGVLSGAASGGVDLNLEGGQNRVDFDLLGEPTASEPAGVGLDLDLGAALGDSHPAGTPDKLGDSGVDFILDDPERGNDATGSTREMPEAPPRPSGATATIQVIGAGNAPSDAPTVEQPGLSGGENATIREKIDAAARGGVTADQTAELALDDLGLDLGQLESGGDETILQGGPDAPTMLTGMDDETRRLISSAEYDDDRERTQITPPRPATSESGTWLFTDADLTDLVPDDKSKESGSEEDYHPTEVVTQITPPLHIDPSSTGRMQTLNTSGLDLDFGNLEADKAGNGIDLDVGAPSVSGEGTFVQTQRISSADVPLPELEPATMSEVGTKLDLARAYMDMGDPEGARSILAEVLSEGSVSQKQEARRLMDTLPG